MAGLNELFDTNILIDSLKGFEPARELLRLSVDPAISVITWMEEMAGTQPSEETQTRRMLSEFVLLGISAYVMEKSAMVRRERKLKLPDAIIFATARVSGRVLVTRNTKDFADGTAGVRVPYRL